MEPNLERWLDGRAARSSATGTRSRRRTGAASSISPPCASRRPIAGGRSLPAAGLPWFMTMFGRDSIFTSLQALPFTPELAATTLRVLGDWQGSRVDDFRDEDPGRILHEMRYGEMTAFEERPHSPYYGCADATPLYVVLLDEYERWTGDRKLVRDLEHEARAALNWIDEYADLQGNGYISYQRRNEETGLENQCWKDSWDSISYRDGRLPGFPRATCELQGYAYDAKMRGARLARLVWKDPAFADKLETRGGRPQAPLQPRLLGRGRRVLRARARHRRQPGRRAGVEQRPPAVERHRRQVQGQGRRAAPAWGRGSSPAGACARWPRARAATTRSATTSAPSGRSTTRSSPGGCAATASRTRRRRSPPASSTPPSSSTAACPRRSAATSARMTKYPVQYPTACSPQAWSTGAPLLLLRTMLGLEPIGEHLVVDPALPSGIGHLELLDIPGRWGRIDAFGRGRVDVERQPNRRRLRRDQTLILERK